MKLRARLILWGILGCTVLIAAHLVSRKKGGADTPPEPVVAPRVPFADAAAAYLVGACGDAGRFSYRVDRGAVVKMRKRYDVGDHALAMLALAAYDSCTPDAATQGAIMRAGEYIGKRAVVPLARRPEVFAVWSDPVITGVGEMPVARLDEAALGLMAFLRVEKIGPGKIGLDNIKKVGDFLLFMQNADGEFRLSYSESGPVTEKEPDAVRPVALAALALLSLHEEDPAGPWRAAAEKGIDRIAKSLPEEAPDAAHAAMYWSESSAGESHLLLAIEELLRAAGTDGAGRDRQPLLDLVLRICTRMMAARADHPARSTHAGCFSDDGLTSPTALAVTGLSAALRILPPESAELRERIGDAVRQGVEFLSRAQIHAAELSGGIPRAIAPLPDLHTSYVEGFNERAGEVRIDYVALALNAALSAARVSGAPE